jgi:hypothetical protein
MVAQIYVLVGMAAIAAASIIYVVFLNKGHRSKFSSSSPSSNIRKKRDPPTNFFIHNYFPSHSISIDVKLPTGDIINMVDMIKPLKTKGLTSDQVRDFLGGGSVLKIYLLPPKVATKIHFLDYAITTDKLERIKSLHVGMITTRFIGTTDVLRMSTVNGNALGGSAFLRVHNLSYIPLSINNGELIVPPHSTEKYKGYLHQGVTLGTYLKADPISLDESKIYPDFQYLKPYTDIYYGVVSDIRQPLNGCWQTEFSDLCDYGQTMWPFEDGIM